jgi:hypothetical protein
LAVVGALKFVHASGQRLLPFLCAVTVRGTVRRGCLAGTSRCRQGLVLLGRSWPQHVVDHSLWTAAAAAPLPFGRLLRFASRSPCAAVALREWSRHRVALAHASLPLSPVRVVSRRVRAWSAYGLSALCRDNVSSRRPSPFPRAVAIPRTRCLVRPGAATISQFRSCTAVASRLLAK